MSARGWQRVLGLLLAACLAAGCASPPPRSEAERQADAALAAQVEAALNADPRLFARHIDVSSEHGKVLLGGYVWSTEDFYRAPQIARAVPGVTDVVSQMELMRGGRGGGGR
jgi:hyperosmotically inducible protein